MSILRRWLLLFLLSALNVGTTVFGENGATVSAEKIFSELAFRPQFPSESEVVLKYGEGVVVKENGNRYRIYITPKRGLWLRFRVDAENRVDNPVTGVLLSRVPLILERSSPLDGFGDIAIKGIRLGDNSSTLERVFGKPLRKYMADLGSSKGMTVLEFFPEFLDPGSCVRFYVRKGLVEAFSFSSEE